MSSAALAAKLGLSAAEHQAIVAALGRPPAPAEVAVFAGLWSEHCSYKSTRALLSALPTAGPGVLAGPGAHAGVVEVGEGWAVAFKIESHNHPSAVEPYQGAATGVGGILRDVIAQGARPCALLDSLCLGPPGTPGQDALAAGIVSGIAGYGNAVGVPNVGGRTVYDPRYARSPLVNVLCAGLLRADAAAGRSARGGEPGCAVLLVGATTGRDGVLGAAFASDVLADDRTAGRPRVQVGDPFMGRKLLEACLSLPPELALPAGQDLGAAGIACATFEIAAGSGIGMDIDLAAVPLREPDLPAAEILLSESQERFLFLARPEAVAGALAHFRRHGVHAAQIGVTTASGRVRARHGGETVVDLPAQLVAGGAPASRWPVAAALPRDPAAAIPDMPPLDPAAVLPALLALPGIADLEPLWSRFDQTVGNRTVRGPAQAAAAVLRLPASTRGFALTVTGRGTQCARDPYRGAQAAVAEALRDLACAGARLVAVTDGLNCGSPRDAVENLRIHEVLRGLGDALRAIAVPVTGGNVSLYNETSAGPIPPTLMLGALGVVPDVTRVPAAGLRRGDAVCLLGTPCTDAVASRFAEWRTGTPSAGPVAVDLDAERRLADLLLAQIAAGRVHAAKGTGQGGLGVALAKLCIRGACGAVLNLSDLPRPDWLLFGEHPAQALVTVAPADFGALAAAAAQAGVPCLRLGVAGGDALQLGATRPLPLSDLRAAFTRTGADPRPPA